MKTMKILSCCRKFLPKFLRPKTIANEIFENAPVRKIGLFAQSNKKAEQNLLKEFLETQGRTEVSFETLLKQVKPQETGVLTLKPYKTNQMLMKNLHKDAEIGPSIKFEELA